MPRTSALISLETTIGAVRGDPTQPEASSQLDIFQIWRVYMLMKAQLEEIIPGLHQGVVGVRKGAKKGTARHARRVLY